jgi:hypothetical protein
MADAPPPPGAPNGTPAATQPPVAAAAQETKPEAQATAQAAEVRRLKMKLADREVELPEDQILEIASQNSSVMYEAQKDQREYAEFLEKLKSDPEGTLKELGLDMDERAVARFAKRLDEEADEETLTPEGKELKTLKAMLAEKEAAEAAAHKKTQEATKAQQKEEAVARIKATVDETIKVGQLSASNFVRNLIIEKFRFNSTHGLPIHPTVLAAEVRETMVENFQDWLQGLSAKHVWAASDKLPEFRKEFVKLFAESKGAKSTPKPPPKTETNGHPKRRTAAEESLRLAEAFKRGIG